MPKKRGNGEGSIFFDEKNKRWLGQVVVVTKADGSLNRKTLYGKTRKEVNDKVLELINSVNDNMVNVNNNDNIMPVAEVGANVVTPVNEINIVPLSDNNVVTDNQSDVNTQPVSIQQEPIASPTVEPINSTEPVIIPPIINNIENNEVSQVSNLVNDSIVVTPVEQTPIANENINNVSFESVEPISTNVEPSIEPVASEQILSQPLSTVVPENNTNDINQIQPETNTGVDNQIETTPIETQPLPQEPENTLTSEQMPQPEVPFGGNPIEGTITMPVIDNPKENEIEEIL